MPYLTSPIEIKYALIKIHYALSNKLYRMRACWREGTCHFGGAVPVGEDEERAVPDRRSQVNLF